MYFYYLNSNITLSDVKKSCNLEIRNSDNDIKISAFQRPSIATQNDLTFFNNNKYSPITESNFILTSKNFSNKFDNNKTLLISNNIDADIAKLSNLFYRSKNIKEVSRLENFVIGSGSDISSNSIINKGVNIGNNFSLGNYSTIGHSCSIGNNVKIGNNVCLSNAIIGDNVTVSDGAKIGQSGFGFAYDEINIIKVFHIGRVIIQNGVKIGTNCAIDRGSFNDTTIGENTYIDNLVHIAHNVSIGNYCIIAGQCGFAGSVEIGNYVHIGGQTGIAGHVKIDDGVKVAAKSGVIRNISSNQTVMGYPAININKYLKNYKKMIIDS